MRHDDQLVGLTYNAGSHHWLNEYLMQPGEDALRRVERPVGSRYEVSHQPHSAREVFGTMGYPFNRRSPRQAFSTGDWLVSAPGWEGARAPSVAQGAPPGAAGWQ